MSFMTFGVLRLGRRFVPPTAPALFTVAGAPLRLRRRTAPTTLLSTATGLRLRLRFRWLRLRLSALPPSFPTLRFATAGALLFATAPTAGLFVACAPLFGAFFPLMGMTSPPPLPAGFRVGAGDRDIRRQRKRTADGDRAALSASVS